MLDPKTGMSKAHTWTRGTNKAPPLPLVVHHQGTVLTHPLEIGKHFAEQWTNLWAQQQPKQELLAKTLKKLIDIAKGDSPLEHITGEMVGKARRYLSNGTALGIDHWSPEEWKRLPPSGL